MKKLIKIISLEIKFVLKNFYILKIIIIFFQLKKKYNEKNSIEKNQYKNFFCFRKKNYLIDNFLFNNIFVYKNSSKNKMKTKFYKNKQKKLSK